MANKKVRMTIEFDINEEMLQKSGIPASGVLKGLRFRESDVVDGFDITTHIPGFDNTSDFFLENGAIVDKMLVEREVSLGAIPTQFKSNEEYAAALFEYLKKAGKIVGDEEDRKNIIHDINNLRGYEWLELVDRNISTKAFFDYLPHADFFEDEFAYGRAIAPNVFLKCVLSEEFSENISFDEVRELLDKKGFKDLWDYSVDDLDEAIDNLDLDVDMHLLGVGFYENNSYFVRIFEITDLMAKRLDSMLVVTERGDCVLPCDVAPGDVVVGPYELSLKDKIALSEAQVEYDTNVFDKRKER